MKIKSYLNGFTLFELIVGLFFSTLAALAIIIGSVHAKKVVNDIRLKQYAFELLRNHTELWKGKIAAGDIPYALSACEKKDICLVKNEEDECLFDANELCYELHHPDIGDSNANRWELITNIKWNNINQVEKELSFYVIQMVF